jgi:hypothetical protein
MAGPAAKPRLAVIVMAAEHGLRACMIAPNAIYRKVEKPAEI